MSEKLWKKPMTHSCHVTHGNFRISASNLTLLKRQNDMSAYVDNVRQFDSNSHWNNVMRCALMQLYPNS